LVWEKSFSWRRFFSIGPEEAEARNAALVSAHPQVFLFRLVLNTEAKIRVEFK
jgi:hypothetical protein